MPSPELQYIVGYYWLKQNSVLVSERFQYLYNVANGLKLGNLVFGNGFSRLFFKRHKKLYNVERVSAEVLDYICIFIYCSGIYIELLGKHFSNFFQHKAVSSEYFIIN